MSDFKTYPLDYTKLTKGQEFTESELGEMFSRKDSETGQLVALDPMSDGFRFAVLGLQESIHRKTGITAKTTSDGGLRLLTDTEASQHNAQYFMRHLRGAINRHSLMIQVDVDNLSGDDKRKHDTTVMRQSRYVSAIVETRKAVTGGQKKELTDGNAE